MIQTRKSEDPYIPDNLTLISHQLEDMREIANSQGKIIQCTNHKMSYKKTKFDGTNDNCIKGAKQDIQLECKIHPAWGI